MRNWRRRFPARLQAPGCFPERAAPASQRRGICRRPSCPDRRVAVDHHARWPCISDTSTSAFRDRVPMVKSILAAVLNNFGRQVLRGPT